MRDRRGACDYRYQWGLTTTLAIMATRTSSPARPSRPAPKKRRPSGSSRSTRSTQPRPAPARRPVTPGPVPRLFAALGRMLRRSGSGWRTCWGRRLAPSDAAHATSTRRIAATASAWPSSPVPRR